MLANLEGSTLVKRLKAASREQYRIAGKLGDHVEDAFGGASGADDADATSWPTCQEGRRQQPDRVATSWTTWRPTSSAAGSCGSRRILDDMRKRGRHRRPAAARRRHSPRSRACRSPSASSGPTRWTAGPKTWSTRPARASAPAAARRAACRRRSCWRCSRFSKAKSTCAKKPASPSRRRPARRGEEARDGGRPARRRSKTRSTSGSSKVIERIRELPDGEAEFGKEIALLRQVSDVMDDAAGILATPETGAPAIAAETEAIELLLKSKRINPKGGGGGGADPRRRRRGGDAGLGAGAAGRRAQPEGSPRGPRHRASRRRNRLDAAGGVPRRARPVLQRTRTSAERWVVPPSVRSTRMSECARMRIENLPARHFCGAMIFNGFVATPCAVRPIRATSAIRGPVRLATAAR